MIDSIVSGVTPDEAGVTTMLHNIAELVRQNRDSPRRLDALAQSLRAGSEAVFAAFGKPDVTAIDESLPVKEQDNAGE